MEQIYYTQCPIGYGLGASNGFQIKRISAGYPVWGDFRHLGLRAFPGGGRTLAPGVLRYRLDGDVAEVARLTPRAQEYQTERGLWGRPGGVFAHGVRLAREELGSFGNWPAGWFNSPAWHTTDPEPTRGRLPDDLEPGSLASFRLAEFAVVAPLFEGESPDWLARVWTALALVAREGRTLFLVDEPDRLARSIALITFGFPPAFRGDLTFSTFHDRPEELPGYRIQGTSPVVRPNRMALLAQGIIADRAAGTIEPNLEPAPWAVTLAGWFTRRGPVDEADWSATEGRAKAARKPGDPIEQTWSDANLGPLFGFPEAYRSRVRPASDRDWVRLGEYARWSGRAAIGDEWLRHRGPDWWIDQAKAAGEEPPESGREARASLVAHASLRDAWRGGASGWGEAVALWFGSADPDERDEAIARLFAAAPRSARPSFAQALIRRLPPEAGSTTLANLRDHPGADRAMLLPLEARVAAIARVNSSSDLPADTSPLHRLILDAAAYPGATAATLDAVAAVAADLAQPTTPGGGVPTPATRESLSEIGEGGRDLDHSESTRLLAGAVAGAFDFDEPDGGREALLWALRRGEDASDWLAPALRPRLADPGRGELFHLLRDRVDPDLWPRLARSVLQIVDDPGLPDDAFRLAVERLLLPLAPRPNHPTWAETYLRRTPSTWDLFRRLYSKESTSIGVPAWIDQARGRGEVSPEQAERIDATRRFARSLSSGDPRTLVELPIPIGSRLDQALFFRQMLARLGGDHLEGLPFVLEACRTAWPGAFAPKALGLKELARPLADRLDPSKGLPRDWLEQGRAILDRLGLTEHGGGFEPDGLLAEVVAALPSGAGASPWPFRQFLFEEDQAWPTLAVTIRNDLEQASPSMAPELVDRWDNKLGKAGKPGLVGRFWELILNAAEPSRLGAIVAARAKDLQSLGPLEWWKHAESVADLRDAYARMTPLAPLPTGRLPEVERWVEGKTNKPTNPDEPIPMVDPEAEATRLSSLGGDRWRCLKALTEYRPTVAAPSSIRDAIFLAWESGLPLANLDREDVYQFMGWLILGIDPTDPPFVDRMAVWLFRVGVGDPRRVSRWVDELRPMEVSAQDQMDRAAFVGTLGREIRKLAEDARGGKRRSTQ